MPGKTYRLETNAVLGTALWTNAGPDITAIGPTASKTNQIAGPRNFFRVRLLP